MVVGEVIEMMSRLNVFECVEISVMWGKFEKNHVLHVKVFEIVTSEFNYKMSYIGNLNYLVSYTYKIDDY